MTGRKTTIEKALAGIYSRQTTTAGTMVESLAIELDKKWEAYVALANKHDTSFEDELTNVIWMWFSGGGTAAIASKAVLAAVNSEASAHEAPLADSDQ